MYTGISDQNKCLNVECYYLFSSCISSQNTRIQDPFIFHLKSAIMTDMEDTVCLFHFYEAKANDLFSSQKQQYIYETE